MHTHTLIYYIYTHTHIFMSRSKVPKYLRFLLSRKWFQSFIFLDPAMLPIFMSRVLKWTSELVSSLTNITGVKQESEHVSCLANSQEDVGLPLV